MADLRVSWGNPRKVEMNRRLLLVDDSATVIQFEMRLLQGLGFETATAENGKQALQQVAAQKPDLILLDRKRCTDPTWTGCAGIGTMRPCAGNTRVSSGPSWSSW
jgi:response regulator RpfG family c-di-GMP phosphodiesterase